MISAAWSLRRSLNLPENPNKEMAIKWAMEVLETDGTPEKEEIEATKILAFAPVAQVDQRLFALIDTRNSPATQQAALEVLLGFESTEVVSNLIDQWASLSPTVRRRITDHLIYNPSNHDLLFASLESGKLNLSEFNFDLERRRRLLKSKDENIRNRAEALFSDAGVVQRKEAIEEMRPALALQGKPKAGSKIFELQCATCHRFGSVGNEVGPDLTEISRKSKETLLHDILDPNAGADPEYINHIIELNDGQVYSGIISEETDDALFIKMMGGQEKNIAKNQIKTISSTGLSLMPEGLEGVLKENDMADLLAFLQQMPM